MKIIRYSKEAFRPQHQLYHLREFVYPHTEAWENAIKTVPSFMMTSVLEQHEKLTKFYNEHLDDLQYGVWAFIDGHKNNQALNHLKEKVPCWSAELPDDTIVYDVNWCYQMQLNDPRCEPFGCYIPERSLLLIENIKQIKKR